MSDNAADSVRLDVWLDVACLFKTRSEAKRACEGGKVEVNGDGAKPHRLIREGDRIRIGRGFGRFQDVIVRIAIDQHVKKSEARALYDDATPKPTPEEIAELNVSQEDRLRQIVNQARPLLYVSAGVFAVSILAEVLAEGMDGPPESGA